MKKSIILQLVVIVAAVSILSVTQNLALSADSAYLQSLKTSDLANKIRQGEVRYRWGKAEIIYEQPEKLRQDFDQARKSQTRWENGSIRISKRWPFGWNWKKTRKDKIVWYGLTDGKPEVFNVEHQFLATTRRWLAEHTAD